MADPEEENAYIDVELEGDQDLVIASRDFEKIANSRMKVRCCLWLTPFDSS